MPLLILAQLGVKKHKDQNHPANCLQQRLHLCRSQAGNISEGKDTKFFAQATVAFALGGELSKFLCSLPQSESLNGCLCLRYLGQKTIFFFPSHNTKDFYNYGKKICSFKSWVFLVTEFIKHTVCIYAQRTHFMAMKFWLLTSLSYSQGKRKLWS